MTGKLGGGEANPVDAVVEGQVDALVERVYVVVQSFRIKVDTFVGERA